MDGFNNLIMTKLNKMIDVSKISKLIIEFPFCLTQLINLLSLTPNTCTLKLGSIGEREFRRTDFCT
jgi:hypothetical protein